MLIGELATRAGTSARALRYYESHGLLRPMRSASGYRVYDEEELRVVHEIRALLAVGFDLDDIRPFVACLRAGNTSADVCPDSLLVLRRKLAEVDSYIERLCSVRQQLQSQIFQAAATRPCSAAAGGVSESTTSDIPSRSTGEGRQNLDTSQRGD
ncbi:MerR family transcriptional regulator [Frankia sp. AgB32]|uniref:MerR family transcriptional regulator n=1 Tax=Frankia sp. AgB32 TaxID=631119 RepID=UPI00200FD638|nr:MerR family transcriptional regulator [Frankia sp. AgB32]MCK9894814.1 MerR family transcriptional regulator [Frankia sp. AgB32]